MIELLIQDKDNNVYPFGLYDGIELKESINNEVSEHSKTKDYEYTVFRVYGQSYRLNWTQLDKCKRSFYYLSRIS